MYFKEKNVYKSINNRRLNPCIHDGGICVYDVDCKIDMEMAFVAVYTCFGACSSSIYYIMGSKRDIEVYSLIKSNHSTMLCSLKKAGLIV